MRSDVRKFYAVLAATTLICGVASAAEEEHRHKEPALSHPSGDTGKHEPGMHMHKSDIVHTDATAATEFKGEADELRAQAESHRKLAKLYAGRTAAKGGGANYATVAKHCEQLAKAYDDAAAAADAMASELTKK